LPSSEVVGYGHVEAEECPYLYGSSAVLGASEAGACAVGFIGDTVIENLQSIGDDAMIGSTCVLIGGNEDITGFSNHDVIIDQEATAAVSLAPSKVTVTSKGVCRKVKERPAAAERVSRPGKRTKIESEFDKLTTLEQTMFIRSKQQYQQALFYSSSATGLSACPLDSYGGSSSSSLELRQRELCELRRELSTLLSIGAEVRSSESKLKRAISRLQKEVASCLAPVQCVKEPAEPVREPLAQLFPLPKHGSVDVQQRCFKADQKADSIMWSLAHQSEDMFTLKAGVDLSDRCKDLVRGFHMSICGSDTNDCVGAPGILMDCSSSSVSIQLDDRTTPQDLENDVEVVILQDGSYTSIVPSSNLAPSHAMNLTTIAEVDAHCAGDQANTSIVVELVAITSHSSSSSPVRGGVVQIVDLTGDTPQPAVRHVGHNEAVAECTENGIMIEDEVVIEDEVIDDVVIEDEVISDVVIEDEVSLGDVVIEDEVISDVVIEDEVSLGDVVIEDEVSLGDVVIEDEVNPCDVVIEDEVSLGDVVIEDDEVSLDDVVIEDEVNLGDVVIEDEVSPGADGLMDGTIISAVEESEVCSSNSSSAPTDRHCILHYDPPMNAAAVTSGCSSQLQSLSSSSSSIVSASQQCHALEATSEPDFSAMPVSELRSIVLSYGLKIDRKANMVHLLSAMWHRLHPFHS
jgi:acetyltransferase-like isoleucine patch superfamily enzyme